MVTSILIIVIFLVIIMGLIGEFFKYLILWIPVLIVWHIYDKKRKETAANNEKAETRSFINALDNHDFNIDRIVEFDGLVLFVDDVNKKWAVKLSVVKIFNFSDLIDFELSEDGYTVMRGGLGRAVVGGALFGVTGAVVGAASGSKVTNLCRLVQLRIRVNDLNMPEITLTFMNKEHKKTSPVYKRVRSNAEKFAAVLAYIQNSGNNN